jgi:hypothetical protein
LNDADNYDDVVIVVDVVGVKVKVAKVTNKGLWVYDEWNA